MARASCRPGCNPHGGCPPRRGEGSELCPAANGDTEARKLGVGSGRGSARAPGCCFGLPARAQIAMEARAGHSPIGPWGLRDQCTAILSWSQSCPHLTNHTPCLLPLLRASLSTLFLSAWFQRHIWDCSQKCFVQNSKGLSPRMWTFLSGSSSI